jgi:hypothetical protein
MLADFLVYLGVFGILLTLLLLIYYLFRRIRWFMGKLQGEKISTPGLVKSIRNLLFIIIMVAVFGMLLFAGFFARAYHAFTLEEEVAEIQIEATGNENSTRVTLVQFLPSDSQIVRTFPIYGDQWMLEGDILKWDNWLNFLGLHTRYRLTRIRGRYLKTEDELNKPQAVYSLVANEDHPLWRYLYEFGPQLPFVSTVYGNAVFQTSHEEKRFAIMVSTSGFLAREINE